MIHQSNIHILILDDSPQFREMLQQTVRGETGLSILPTVTAGSSPEKTVKATAPDVIILNESPGRGFGSLSSLLDRLRPCAATSFAPCIVIGPGAPETMRAVGEHDAEFIRLSSLDGRPVSPSFCNEVCTKVKLAAVAATSMRISAGISPTVMRSASLPVTSGKNFRYHIIAIGASTGGTEATAKIMENLPAEMPGIVITQHMPADFTKMYADRLNRISKLSVSEAKDGDRVEPGTAFVAPGGLQMSLKRDARGYFVHCAPGEKVNGHCPSVGVLFDSVAKCAGKNAIGVLLTGMGHDGAYELLHMREAGAYTIGQDRESCVVYGMPMVAYDVGAVMQQLPLNRIADVLIHRVV